MIKVWLYAIASFFSLAVLFAARHFSGGTHLQFMGESLGLVIVLLSCQICFHLNGVDELLVDSKPQIFIQKILKSAGAGLVIAALLYIFPRLSPGYAAAAASVCFLMFGLVVLRPIVRSLTKSDEAEGTVIVGSETMARKLYSEIVDEDAGTLRVVKYTDLRPLFEREAISRIVVADPEIQEESDATVLIDLKLRGVRVESAVDSFERASRKIWIEGLSRGTTDICERFLSTAIYLFVKRVLDLGLAISASDHNRPAHGPHRNSY